MLKNEIIELTREEIYKNHNIVFINSYRDDEIREEKYFYMRGSKTQRISDFARNLGIEDVSSHPDVINDQLNDFFVYDANFKYVIIIDDSRNFLAQEDPNDKSWIDTLREIFRNFENDVTVTQGGLRKSIDLYLCSESLDFDELDMYIRDVNSRERNEFLSVNSIEKIWTPGSIVEVNENGKDKRVMIIDNYPYTEGEVFDYSGLEIGKGEITDLLLLFNAVDIKSVIHEGYSDKYVEDGIKRKENTRNKGI